MSHFTVAVIHNEDEDINDVLAPFQENNMDNCPEEYLEFNDMENEYKEEYEKGSRDMYKTPEGKFVSVFDDAYSNPKYTFSSKPEIQKYIFPDTFEKVSVPFKELYKTFEEFVEDWNGDKERDEEMKRFGYWENPNARWDWFVVGGRWRDGLKLFAGKSEVVSAENGINKTISKEGWCDSAKIKDVDWDGMQSYNEGKYTKLWEEAHERLANEAIKKDGLSWEYGIEKDETKEEYVKRQSEFTFYSLLIDGDWQEAGTMGWFGSSSASKEEQDDWDKQKAEVIKMLIRERSEDVITLVDCHI